MPEKFRKWTPWIVAVLLSFSLLINVHCVTLLYQYRQIYQAPPVWATESGEIVTGETTISSLPEQNIESASAISETSEPSPAEADKPNTADTVSVTTHAQAGSTVYLTKSGTKFHRDGCSSLSKSKIAIAYEDAVERGFEPCGRCKP